MNKRRAPPPILWLLLFALMLANASLPTALNAQETNPPEATAQLPASSLPLNGSVCITARIDGTVQTLPLEEYLVGVVAAEMPASFASEALKAQAVAARTYLLSRMRHRSTAHPDADVCGDPACCTAWSSQQAQQTRWGADYVANHEKLCRAISETAGMYLTWQGEPIQAVFHAASAGQTAASGELWNELPYLVSVSSPETADDVPNYISTVEVAAEDFRQTILQTAPHAALSGDASGWLGAQTQTESGRVDTLTIGGVPLNGQTLRTLFSLRSTMFTLEYTDSVFRFTVSGYGHGVGMSQYGANVMAQQGADYTEILSHYFPGASLDGVSRKNIEQVAAATSLSSSS